MPEPEHPSDASAFPVTQGDGCGPVRPEQWQRIEKGSGEFALSQVIRDHGCLHLTFYDVDTGDALGGFYFGTQEQVDEIKALSSDQIKGGKR